MLTAAFFALLPACTEPEPSNLGTPDWYSKCTHDCNRHHDSDTYDYGDSTSIDEEPPPDLSITAAWSNEGVELELLNSPDTTYYFGMAETGAGQDGWYGEDCVDSTETGGYNRCHSAGENGAFWASSTLDEFRDDTKDDLTLFTDSIAAGGGITYVLATSDGSACWTWGDDPRYYGDYDCYELG